MPVHPAYPFNAQRMRVRSSSHMLTRFSRCMEVKRPPRVMIGEYMFVSFCWLTSASQKRLSPHMIVEHVDVRA